MSSYRLRAGVDKCGRRRRGCIGVESGTTGTPQERSLSKRHERQPRLSRSSPLFQGDTRAGLHPEPLLNVAVPLRLDRNLFAALPGAIRRNRDDERENDEGERDADHLCIWGIQGSTQSEEPEDQHHQAQERGDLPLG